MTMRVMLAENLTGWGIAFLVFCAALSTSLLALGALFPAARNHHALAIRLVAPAFILGALVTGWFVAGYLFKSHHESGEFGALIGPWIFLGGLPLAISLLIGSVIRSRRRRGNL